MNSSNHKNRRNFIKSAVAGSAVIGSALTSQTVQASINQEGEQKSASRFNAHFAPHPGTFKFSAGKDPIDQIKFAHDQGFTAWEWNGLPDQPPEFQEKVGKTMADLNMKMGVFVGYANFDAPTFARKTPESTAEVLANIKSSVDVAKRVNAKWFTVVPGSVDQQVPKENAKWNRYGGGRIAMGYQTANVIDLLRRCCDILEPHGLVMVLEPLNWFANHGGTFLTRSDQAFAICKAVNSPSCKILFDIYHQQITEGNLITNINLSWDEIAYFQAGDNPGRKEPGTGEINYQKVFQHIHDKSVADGKSFVIGMEHGNSIKGLEGEKKVIEAYRAVDPQ